MAALFADGLRPRTPCRASAPLTDTLACSVPLGVVHTGVRNANNCSEPPEPVPASEMATSGGVAVERA